MPYTKLALILLASASSLVAFAAREAPRCEQRILAEERDQRSQWLRFYRAAIDRQVQARLNDAALRSEPILLDGQGMRALRQLAYWASSEDRVSLERVATAQRDGRPVYAASVVYQAQHALRLLSERERLVGQHGLEVASVRWAQMSRTQGYLVEQPLPERWAERHRILDLVVTANPMARLRLLESDRREAPQGRIKREDEIVLLKEQLSGAMARLWKLNDNMLFYIKDANTLNEVANDSFALMRLGQLSRQDEDLYFIRDYNAAFNKLPQRVREQLVLSGVEQMVRSLNEQILQTKLIDDDIVEVNTIFPNHYYPYVSKGIQYRVSGSTDDYHFVASGMDTARSSPGLSVEWVGEPGTYRVRSNFEFLDQPFSLEQKVIVPSPEEDDMPPTAPPTREAE